MSKTSAERDVSAPSIAPTIAQLAAARRVDDAAPATRSDLFQLIAAITRLRDAKLDRTLKPLGLNVTRCQALTAIARREPCTMSELADLSAIDRTTLTRIVDQLVARDLAQRATRSQDRRQVLLTLTPEGRAVHRSALDAIGEVDRVALQGLPRDGLETVAQAHQAIMANLTARER